MSHTSSRAVSRWKRFGTNPRQNPLSKIFLVLILLSPWLAPAIQARSALAAPSVGFGLVQQSPRIYDISLNLTQYPHDRVPRYAKLEITFQVETTASNLQLPYDPTPPAGLEPGIGITVDALFSPDNWQTVYRQPAFYYQYFEDQVKGGREWFYPTSRYAWKVRFSPDQVGEWQFRLAVQDAGGRAETLPQTFQVSASNRKGFVRVSARDPRYFEFEEGTYFPGLGYNMNYDHISWTNPTLDNQETFQQMSQNGIQLVRLWLSQWGIYGSAWNPWNAIDPALHSQYIPYTGLTGEEALPKSEVSLRLQADVNPCMFTGWQKAAPAVKRNTTYKVRIRYRTVGLQGPRQAGKPFGLVAKTGDWLWGQGKDCQDPDTGQVVSAYSLVQTDGWQILEGSWNSGERDFLPYFYLALENVSAGQAYIDSVWIEADLGDGQFGPNILPKPWMAQHLYMEQRNSYAFDKVVELAERTGVYLRPVILEKNEFIFNHIDSQGRWVPDDKRCRDDNTGNDPAECPGNRWFYGDYQQMTKVRWLQQAWWRYLQARWGYSTQIHSWELLNEGDPWDERHYALAEAFGKYMHAFQPDEHLVSTSFWHSFPLKEFWANPDYAHVDFADLHQYYPDGAADFDDAALATYTASQRYSALQGAGKPVVRGETGFIDSAGSPAELLQQDQQGVWLHNLIWGGINSGGMLESYWFDRAHIYKQKADGRYAFDHRPLFHSYYNFIGNIPLNNGRYQDAQALVSNENIRVWGQKDLQDGRAHLWIQNAGHTWQNVLDKTPVPAVSGSLAIGGFQPGESYELAWWDPYQPDISRQVFAQQRLTARSDGFLLICWQDLASDVALTVQPALAGKIGKAEAATVYATKPPSLRVQQAGCTPPPALDMRLMLRNLPALVQTWP